MRPRFGVVQLLRKGCCDFGFMPGNLYSADLAYVHHVGFGEFARRAAPGLLIVLEAAKLSHCVLVDLGCGSGIWLCQAAQAGYQTIGVDISPAMLQLARRNSPPLQLFCTSLHTFSLPPCAAITAIGEALCYLPANASKPPSLLPVFRRATDALGPGGRSRRMV